MQISNKNIISTSVDMAIPFYDVDSMGITWHGNYLKYFEMARCELLKLIDYDYPAMQLSGYGWPVVDLRVKYIKPTVFKQEITVTASLVEYENRLKIEYLIIDHKTKQTLTSAYSIQVAVDLKTEEMCFVSPDILLNKIRKLL